MNEEKLLEEVKLFVFGQSGDTEQDPLIRLAITESIERILSKLNDYSEEEILVIPSSLTFVVRDVAIKRFNRLNSEGTSSDSEEGRSFVWERYLDEYETTLRRVAQGRHYAGKGRARFI